MIIESCDHISKYSIKIKPHHHVHECFPIVNRASLLLVRCPGHVTHTHLQCISSNSLHELDKISGSAPKTVIHTPFDIRPVKRVRWGAHITMMQSLIFRAHHGEVFMNMVVWFDLDAIFWYIFACFNHHFLASATGVVLLWTSASFFFLRILFFWSQVFCWHFGISRLPHVKRCVDYCLWSTTRYFVEFVKRIRWNTL